MSFSTYSTEKSPDAFVVYLVGTLDTNTYGILDKKLAPILDRSPRTIIFDMEKLEYISSMGVRIILRTQQTLQKNGGAVHLINLKPQIRKVFEIINALPTEQIFSSVEELDQYLDAMQRKTRA